MAAFTVAPDTLGMPSAPIAAAKLLAFVVFLVAVIVGIPVAAAATIYSLVV